MLPLLKEVLVPPQVIAQRGARWITGVVLCLLVVVKLVILLGCT
jgi:hypothetical protein